MTQDEFEKKYLSQLDDNQRLAVTTLDGPVLVLAVPGSGKTTALVHRIGYMVNCVGIAPENILTITYTTAATRDMKNRFESLFGKDYGERLAFRTINGICTSILKHYAKLNGRTLFDLLDSEKDAPRVVTEILRDVMDEYPTEAEVKEMTTAIAYCKNMLLSETEIAELSEKRDIPIAEVYKRYQKTLKERSLMDYDDQLLSAFKILKNEPDFLAYYQKRFKYILVDEAQDTSKVQHFIIRLLVGESGNLFMVGDEDQSIYGFRAAYPEALLSFRQNYQNARIIVMNRNYRSNANIVAAADRLIQHNKSRYDKKMVATRPASSDVRFIDVEKRSNQYGYLVKVAQDCQRETAVLYRDNECALPLVDRLDRMGIPYRIKNQDLTFFSNRVVMDVVNLIRLALNPLDTDAFLKVYYRGFVPMRKEEARDLCDFCAKQKVSILRVLESMEFSNYYAETRAGSFVNNVRKMKEETPSKAIWRIRKAMKYDEYLEENSIGDGKLFTLEMIAYNEESLESFLSRLTYLRDLMQNGEQDSSSKFILSTIHSAKGLEYDQVYLMDVFDGCIPLNPSSKQNVSSAKALMEEERRLFYVGVTRAKNNLNIFRIGENESKFVHELEPKKGQSVVGATPYKKQENLNYIEQKLVGRKVEHRSFGRGTIVSVSVDLRGDKAIDVRFEDRKLRTLMYPRVFQKENMWFIDRG